MFSFECAALVPDREERYEEIAPSNVTGLKPVVTYDAEESNSR